MMLFNVVPLLRGF